jgi:hypothetical protein
VELFKETFSTEIVEPSKLILEGKKKKKKGKIMSRSFSLKKTRNFFTMHANPCWLSKVFAFSYIQHGVTKAFLFIDFIDVSNMCPMYMMQSANARVSIIRHF